MPGKEPVPFCFRMTGWVCGSGVSYRKGNILPLLTETVLGEPERWGSHCWELGEVKSSCLI